MNKSAQQLLDEQMCRPGYRWNDTLKKCLGGYGGGGEAEIPQPDPVPEPQMPSTNPPKGGRGDVRVNANGVKQTGTKMGNTLPM